MKNRRAGFIIVSMFLFLSFMQMSSLKAQLLQKDYLPMEYSKWMVYIPENGSDQPFYISSKPVTNKEYILFLAWTARIYVDYPEELFDLLPGKDSTWNGESGNPFADSVSFKYYIEHSKPFVSEYMFNPLYLNAAVIGVSWDQANKYCHWLSDRYNEYSLIRKKYLAEDRNQVDDNNFSTESFVFHKYEGLWGKVGVDKLFSQSNSRGFDFCNYQLRPSFHIATQYELINASSVYTLIDCYCTEAKGSEFLSIFYKNYLRDNKGFIYYDPDPYGEENKTYFLASNFDFKTFDLPKKASEWCLDSYLATSKQSIRDIYKGYGYDTIKFVNLSNPENTFEYPEKNRLGLMDLIITGEYDNREIEMIKAPLVPVVADRSVPYLYDQSTKSVVNRNGDTFTTFRFAVNAIRKPVKK